MHYYPHDKHTCYGLNTDGTFTAFQMEEDDSLVELYTGSLFECTLACERAEQEIREEAEDELAAQLYDWRGQ